MDDLPTALSVEQMCRNLLEQAVKDGLVRFAAENFENTTDPQQLTAGDLTGMSNLLHAYLQKPKAE